MLVMRDSTTIRRELEEAKRAVERLEWELFPAEARRDLESGICLQCGDPIADRPKGATRGCHASCRQSLGRLIRKGKMTEEFAIESGILAPEQERGRPAAVSDKVQRALSKAAMSDDADDEFRHSLPDLNSGDEGWRRAKVAEKRQGYKQPAATKKKSRPSKKKGTGS